MLRHRSVGTPSLSNKESLAPGAIDIRILRARCLISTWQETKEFHDMQTHYPAFHAEYWVYILAAVVIIVFGTLLYTVGGPSTPPV